MARAPVEHPLTLEDTQAGVEAAPPANHGTREFHDEAALDDRRVVHVGEDSLVGRHADLVRLEGIAAVEGAAAPVLVTHLRPHPAHARLGARRLVRLEIVALFVTVQIREPARLRETDALDDPAIDQHVAIEHGEIRRGPARERGDRLQAVGTVQILLEGDTSEHLAEDLPDLPRLGQVCVRERVRELEPSSGDRLRDLLRRLFGLYHIGELLELRATQRALEKHLVDVNDLSPRCISHGNLSLSLRHYSERARNHSALR